MVDLPRSIRNLKDNHRLLLGATGVMYRVGQYPLVDKLLFHRKGNEIFREGMRIALDCIIDRRFYNLRESIFLSRKALGHSAFSLMLCKAWPVQRRATGHVLSCFHNDGYYRKLNSVPPKIHILLKPQNVLYLEVESLQM